MAPQARAAEVDYPSKPVTIIVACETGGQDDTVARLVADRLTTAYKQSGQIRKAPEKRQHQGGVMRLYPFKNC